MSKTRLGRLRMLTEVSRALTYTTSIEEVLDLAVSRTAALMGAEQALIMLQDDDGLLVLRAAHGVKGDHLAQLHEPLDEGLVRTLQKLLDYPSEECFLSVPLVAQGEVTGLMAAVRSSGEPVTADDEWLLSALADQTAVALENARLTREVARGQEEMGRALSGQDRVRATLGHELRSPLTAIRAYTTLLLDDALDPVTDRQREAISRIRLSGEHLLAVIESLLDMGRISAGALSLEVAKVPLDQVLRSALEMLQPGALEKKQSLNSSGESDLVVVGDPGRLRQTFVNLIGNAIKYTPPGGAIDVAVTSREWQGAPCAAIAVTDTGRGIPESALGRLFQPYERGETAERETGLGLGLYIARQLARGMDGDIEVESEPGVGSTFTVLIPLAGQ